jgi:hypothetical protein
MGKLTNKKVLLISPKTFNYESEIKRQLEIMGAQVTYFDDRPFISKLKKIILRLAPVLLNNETTAYFNNLIEETKNSSFDYILCIKQECFPYDLLKNLLSIHSQAQAVFYTWDSFANNPNALKNLELFNRKLTFDRADADKYDILHRPLFYLNEFSEMKSEVSHYDLSFIGSVHYKRYQFLKNIQQNLDVNKRTYFYQYVPSLLLFYGRKFLLFPWYGLSQKSDFNFRTLNKNEVGDVFSKSEVIVDYAHHNQTGLTMRCIEALGANKKLLTNNINIKNYDFYNPSNILVLSERNFDIPDSFFENSYHPVEDVTYRRYSIAGWLGEVLDL